jgi:uncharacterized membrane protein (DUF4010 family)
VPVDVQYDTKWNWTATHDTTLNTLRKQLQCLSLLRNVGPTSRLSLAGYYATCGRATFTVMDPIFQQLGISVLLGLLVGLQREHAASGTAGLRTFPLIALLGSLSAMLANHYHESWTLAAGLLAIVAVTVVGHLFRSQSEPHSGTTTDVSMLLMYVVGALVVIGPMSVAIAVGGGMAVLLQFKPELHGIARKLGDEDLRAIMQFVLITCIILPVLPNHYYGPTSFMHTQAAGQQPGPLDVLNPFEIWLMVVLIVGLSLAGYIIYKFFGRNARILLGGIIGGAVSSTATTVSYARAARSDPSGAHSAAVVIMVASTLMYLRMLAEVTVASQNVAFLKTVVLPLTVMMLADLLPALAMWFRVRHESPQMPAQKNPAQLKFALVFGLLYAVIVLALAAAKHYWNGQGLYVVAFVSGLTEVDAVTLSTARLSLSDSLVATDGWRILVIAAMANLVSTATIAGLLGGWRFLVRISLLFALPMLCGAALLMFW